jgi:predicted AAA+ superfamily ATPase
MQEYRPRLVDRLLRELLSELPAVLIVGPRASGKTTTANRIARSVVRLDREAEAAAFVADADAAIRGLSEPVLLDEWQAVPSVLGAVKRAVDVDPRPGRFLLTGSVRADIEAQTWPGTGRLVRLAMFGLTVREIGGDAAAPAVIDRLVEMGAGALRLPAQVPDLRDYLELALSGAFPEPALRLSSAARQRWLDGYVEQLLTRDATHVGGERDPVRLRRYFEALALNTAGVVEDKKLYDAAGINSKTAAAYERLLANLLVLEAVPAWTTNRLKRLARSAKRYLVDPALATAALRMDVDGVLRDGDLMGRILDTFVMAQLRAEATVSTYRPRLHHLRAEQGRHEIDMLIELSGDRVVAIEVKADAAPGSGAAQHLRWLRDELGRRFVAGVVLHTGPRAFEVDDRIAAVPICALWG